MKKNIFLILLLAGHSLWSQSPKKMNYQAVVRNATNDLVVNADIGLKLSVLKGSASGKVVYAETHKPRTNLNGLFSIEIGGGLPTLNTMDSVDWSNGIYFLKTEIDPTGGVGYTITNISQFLSVPYSEYSSRAGGLSDYAVYEEQYANTGTLPVLNAGNGTNYVANVHKFNAKVIQKGSSISLSSFSGTITLQPGLYSIDIMCPIQGLYQTDIYSYISFTGSLSNQLNSYLENYSYQTGMQIIRGVINVQSAETFTLYQYINSSNWSTLNSTNKTIATAYTTVAKVSIIKLQ
jgi:hypothetical protein